MYARRFKVYKLEKFKLTSILTKIKKYISQILCQISGVTVIIGKYIVCNIQRVTLNTIHNLATSTASLKFSSFVEDKD